MTNLLFVNVNKLIFIMAQTFPFVSQTLLKKIEQLNAMKKKQVLKTWSRSSTIVPVMIGHVRHESH